MPQCSSGLMHAGRCRHQDMPMGLLVVTAHMNQSLPRPRRFAFRLSDQDMVRLSERGGSCEGSERRGRCEGSERRGSCEGSERRGSCDGSERGGSCEGSELVWAATG